jgi:hypothetical protein
VSFEQTRAVEVFAGGGYGSGYRITTTAVLTCAHLVPASAGSGITVRDLSGTTWAATVAWRSSARDLMLVELDVGRDPAEPPLPPVTFGRFGPRLTGTIGFRMIGWPRAGAAVPDGQAGQWVRDPVQVDGVIKVDELAGSRTKLLRLRPDDELPAISGESWWEGMSGAAVFCGDLLVAVQSRQQRDAITSYLAATLVAEPAEATDVDTDGLDEELARLGVGVRRVLDEQETAALAHAERLATELARAPVWFPARLRDDGEALDRLHQEPVITSGTAGRRAALLLGDMPAGTRAVIVSGSAGRGKSWALAADARATALTAIRRLRDADEEPVVLPAFCRLADLASSATGLADLLGLAMRGSPLGAARAAYHTNGPVFRVTVDGVDEATEEQKRCLLRAIDELLGTDHPEVVLLIVGTRPGEIAIPPDPKLMLAELRDFDAAHQNAFVDAWFAGDRAEGADELRALAGDWRVADAFRTPLLLALACLAVENVHDAPLRGTADILRAAVQTLADNAHRGARGRSVGTVADRRRRRRLLLTLARLGDRCFATGSFRPSLSDEELVDLDAEDLDACLETGLFTLRGDGGVDVANRTLATYLAAQHRSLEGRASDGLDLVWESDDLGQIATFVPHALSCPLVGEEVPGALEDFFAAVDALVEQGDPGFVLLHVVSRGLTYLEPGVVAERRADVVRTLRAHLVAGVDLRAADSLAALDPGALLSLADEPDRRVAQAARSTEHTDGSGVTHIELTDASSSERLAIGLVLANVGYDEAFPLLEDQLLSVPDDVAAAAVVEWLWRRGGPRGAQIVERLAAEGPLDLRMTACLLLAARNPAACVDTLAAALAATDTSSYTRYAFEIAGVLHELGDARGTTLLRRERDTGSPYALQAIAWLGDEELADAEPVLVRLAGELPLSKAALAGGVLLDLDRERGLRALEEVIGRAWDDGALFPLLLLMEADRERGLAAVPLALSHAPERMRFGLAALLEGYDAAMSADLLEAVAKDDAAEVGERIAAARTLERLEPERGRTTLQTIRDTYQPDPDQPPIATTLDEALDSVGDGSAFVRAALTSFSWDVAQAAELGTTPTQYAARAAELLRQIDDVRPSLGQPRDLIDDGLFGLNPDTETGEAPRIMKRFDLDRERDRRMLALVIPLFDYPGDRLYFVDTARVKAPSDDWLRYMTRWALGDFSDLEGEDEEVEGVWGEAIRGVVEELGGGLAEWMVIAWNDVGWIANRCYPLVLRAATAGVLLELSHGLPRPAPPGRAAALNAGRTAAGLSATDVRACIGRVGCETVADGLAGHDDSPDLRALRERYEARAAGLICTHGARPRPTSTA